MSEKKWTSEDMSAAIERALQTMENIALELYRRGREEAREELEAVKRERDEARAEVERLHRMFPVHPSSLTDACTDAYGRGAEAMREACARWMSEREGISQWVYDDALSALPIPEEK